MPKKIFDPIIKTTTDYRIFRTMNGNRDLNEKHLKRLKASIEEKYLFSPVIVNERKEVIDGQHRLRVCRELGLPVHYIIVYGYGVKEVQVLNANMSNWRKTDYLDGFVKEGREPYIQFKKFQEDYPKLNFSTCLKILTGKRGESDSQGSAERFGQGGIAMRNFENGNLVIPDLKQSYKLAEMITDYREVFERYNDGTFVRALLTIFAHPNYKHETMIHKIKLQPNELILCRSQEQYLIRLENIFNYKNRQKVSLRF